VCVDDTFVSHSDVNKTINIMLCCFVTAKTQLMLYHQGQRVTLLEVKLNVNLSSQTKISSIMNVSWLLNNTSKVQRRILTILAYIVAISLQKPWTRITMEWNLHRKKQHIFNANAKDIFLFTIENHMTFIVTSE